MWVSGIEARDRGKDNNLKEDLDQTGRTIFSQVLFSIKIQILFALKIFLEQRLELSVVASAQLGVNGYSFAITNNGYVIFHPRFDPMVRSALQSLGTACSLAAIILQYLWKQFVALLLLANAVVVMRSVVSVCLCVRPVRALTFESFDL